jgi:ribosome biogenesis protein MAK21
MGGKGGNPPPEPAAGRPRSVGVAPAGLELDLREGHEDPRWHVSLDALGPLPSGKGRAPAVDEEQRWAKESRATIRAREEAEAALETYREAAERREGRGGVGAKWLRTAKESGTISDRVAAASLLVQSSVGAHLASLDMLVGWVERNKGGRHVVGQALDALRELFSGFLLPDRALVHFSDQQLNRAGPPGTPGRARRLMLWHVEDCVKKRYFRYVEALEALSRDNLDFLKQKALGAAADLLEKKPELEARLLQIVVNKLGDPDRKLAATAGHHLGRVLQAHPVMKVVLVKEVEHFIFRPGLQQRARYAGTVFLTQVLLSRKKGEGGSDLAERLIHIYLTLFDLQMRDAERELAEAHQRTTSASGGQGKGKGKGNGKGKGKGKGKASGKKGSSAPKNDGKKGGEKAGASPTRGHAQVDSRMLNAILTGINRAFPYVAHDRVEQLVERHTPVLFKLVHGPNFPAAVQALMLLFKIMNVHLAVSDRFYRALYGLLHSKDLVTSSKTPQVLSLTLKAMRADVNIRRVSAFLKRLLQVSSEAGAPFCCGVLILVSEVLQGRPSLWGQIREPEAAFDDEEHYEDMPEEDSGASDGEELARPASEDARPTTEGSFKPTYDISKREPAFCGAETACLWELSALSNHVHPSVSAMAESLLAGSAVEYTGNPMTDLSLGNFLSKFATKKSKPPPTAQGRANAGSMRLNEDSGGLRAQVGTRAFVALGEAEIRPEEVFFHRYYSAHLKRGGGLQGYQGDLDEAELAEEARREKSLAFGATGPEGEEGARNEAYDADDYEEEDLGDLPDELSEGDEERSGPDSDDSSEISLPAATGGEGTPGDEAVSGGTSESSPLSFSDGDSSGDDDEPEPRGKRGRDDPMAAFASATDYQHLIGDNVPNQGRSSANKKKRTKL